KGKEKIFKMEEKPVGGFAGEGVEIDIGGNGKGVGANSGDVSARKNALKENVGGRRWGGGSIRDWANGLRRMNGEKLTVGCLNCGERGLLGRDCDGDGSPVFVGRAHG